jgi:D-alanyl-D-alanine-carboxypeptidase/D-alanyl-D-alanine-endopeptidase
MCRPVSETARKLSAAGAASALLLSLAGPTIAQDTLLSEVVEFTGAVLYLDTQVPALVIGAVHNGETAVSGFGEIVDGSGKEPDGDTLMRIGSITKVFTGTVLASMVADGTVRLTDPLQDHLDWGVTVPKRGDHQIRLINLATHTAGLPREVEREPGPPDNPFSTLTPEVYAEALAADPLLFPPGTGALYSNFGYDVLGAALGDAADKPYVDVLQERVLDPVGLGDTKLKLGPGDEARLMQGHDFYGNPLPHVPTTPIMAGAGALYSTTNDMLKWLERHMSNLTVQHASAPWPQSNNSPATEAEIRLIDHAAYVFRDQLDPVSGLDESGHMDAMALGWVIMTADEGRPLILQKAGGLQGIFVYSAFSPAKKIGVFVAINEFDFSAAQHMATVVNEMIATIAPR